MEHIENLRASNGAPSAGQPSSAHLRDADARAPARQLPAQPIRNRLLAALPATELAFIRPHLEPVWLEQRELLFEAETPITHIHFPETAVVSMVSRLREGGTVEVGTAGCEGIVGLSVFLADDTSSVDAFTQVAGVAWRMDVASFGELAATRPTLHRLLLRYTQAFLTQVAQTAACNAAHLVEQRCARWLLTTHDRVQGEVLALTHEFLAAMLCVRRPGVTVAMRALHAAGLVKYTRGNIRITDRGGLERASCECYDVVRARFASLLPSERSISGHAGGTHDHASQRLGTAVPRIASGLSMLSHRATTSPIRPTTTE